MLFSDEAWSRVRRLVASIHDHPFNRGLADGTLDAALFRAYVIQDARYLAAFSRALSLAAARAERPEDAAFLVRQAQESTAVERQLHETLFRQLGVDPDEAAAAAPTPATFAYVNYLLAIGYHEPYGVVLAGLLPCFWIYWEVGHAIRGRAAAGNPYQAWIDTYAGEEYGSVVRQFIALTDREADGVAPALRGRMLEAFVQSTRLEWLFWDDAYRQRGWPEG